VLWPTASSPSPSVIVAEIGENVSAGQPVLAITKTGKRRKSFNGPEYQPHSLTVGATVAVARPGIEHLQLVISKMKRETIDPRSEHSQRLIDQMGPATRGTCRSGGERCRQS
jgi:hypothetical protein